MIYEEKLQKVIGKLKDERELTRKGRKTQVTFDDKSFTKVRINDICKILLKLRDDERVVSLVVAFQPMQSDPTKFEQCNNDDDDFERVVEIIVEVDEVFDSWYENHLLHQKTKPHNLVLPSLHLEKLQSIYDRATNAQSNKIFFLSVYEYIELFDNQKDLEFIWKKIVRIGKAENMQLESLATKAYEEMRNVYAEIKVYIESNGVNHPGVLHNLRDFQAYEDGSMFSSIGPLRAREGELSYSLMLLVEDKTQNHIPFCRKYGKISDEGKISDWHFSPSFNNWKEERERMDRLQKTTVWYSWDKLVHLHNIYKDYEELRNECIASNKLFDMWGIKMAFDEIAYIMGDKKELNKDIHEYVQSDYLLYLQRVHQYAKDMLMTARAELEQKKNHQIAIAERPTNEPNVVNSVAQKSNKELLMCGKLQLDLDNGTLRFGDNPSVEISSNNKIIQFLELLMLNQRVVEYVEIAKSLGMNCWHENVENKDVAREVQYLKRDLGIVLREKVGMSNKYLRDMIISKKNIGYKLRCEANSLKTH